jgi:2-hydroxychromene-2-carboxylate isomerase
MAGVIEFWFDFSSPYGYFAAAEIDRLAAETGRTIVWRPVLLGVVFQSTGMQPLAETPLRGDYARHDWARIARLTGVPFQLPTRHPIAAVAASRAFYWIEQRDPAAAISFARRIFHAYFAEDAAIDHIDVVGDVAQQAGVDRTGLLAALQNAGTKAAFRARTDEALAKGVFGSPYCIVDGEPFWGWDRLAMMKDWIQRGGW